MRLSTKSRLVHFFLSFILFIIFADLAAFTACSQISDQTKLLERMSALWESVHEDWSAALISDYFSETFHATQPEMHSLLCYMKEADRYEVSNVSKKENVMQLQILLYSMQGQRLLHVFFVREGRKWVVDYPWRILTRNWQKHETDFFVFHYQENQNAKLGIQVPTETGIELLNAKVIYLQELFNVRLTKKIHIYLANSHMQMDRLVGVSSHVEGFVIPPLYLIVTIYPFSVAHELTHLFHANFLMKEGLRKPYYDAIYRPDHLRFLAEGLAEHGDLDGGSQMGHLCHENVRRLIKTKHFLPIEELLDGKMTVAQSTANRNFKLKIVYPELSSFIAFLIQNFGVVTFRRFIKDTYQSTDIVDALVQNYKRSLAEMQTTWLDWLETEAPDDIPPERTAYFRIITSVWPSTHFDKAKIYYEPDYTLDEALDIIRKWSRRKNIVQAKRIYIARSVQRLNTINVKNTEFYQNGETIILTRPGSSPL